MEKCYACSVDVEKEGDLCPECGAEWMNSIYIDAGKTSVTETGLQKLIQLELNNTGTNLVLGNLPGDFLKEHNIWAIADSGIAKSQIPGQQVQQLLRIMNASIASGTLSSRFVNELVRYPAISKLIYNSNKAYSEYIDKLWTDTTVELNRLVRRRHKSIREKVKLKRHQFEYKLLSIGTLGSIVASFISLTVYKDYVIWVGALTVLLVILWFVLKYGRYGFLTFEGNPTIRHRYYIDTTDVPESYLKTIKQRVSEIENSRNPL